MLINELEKNMNIDDLVTAVKEIQAHKTKNGDPYYKLSLQDKSGLIKCNVWSSAFTDCINLDELKVGEVISVSGQVEQYKGENQMTIKSIKYASSYDVKNLMSFSNKNFEEMWEDLTDYIEKIKNVEIKKLLENIVIKDSRISKLYKTIPAGEFVHHNFIGGLLEHVLELLKISDAICNLYPIADKDLVIAGCILHDIGKIEELMINKTLIERTVEGYLIGHLNQGIDLVKRYIPEDFDKNTWMQLEHIIISHNKYKENGSAVTPATIEAAIVSCVDDTSFFVRVFDTILKTDKPDSKGMSQYNKYIGNKVYFGSRDTLPELKNVKENFTIASNPKIKSNLQDTLL